MSLVGSQLLDIFIYSDRICVIAEGGLGLYLVPEHDFKGEYNIAEADAVAWLELTNVTCGAANDYGIFLGTIDGIYFLPLNAVNLTEDIVAHLASFPYINNLIGSNIQSIAGFGTALAVGSDKGINFFSNLFTGYYSFKSLGCDNVSIFGNELAYRDIAANIGYRTDLPATNNFLANPISKQAEPESVLFTNSVKKGISKLASNSVYTAVAKNNVVYIFQNSQGYFYDLHVKPFSSNITHLAWNSDNVLAVIKSNNVTLLKVTLSDIYEISTIVNNFSNIQADGVVGVNNTFIISVDDNKLGFSDYLFRLDFNQDSTNLQLIYLSKTLSSCPEKLSSYDNLLTISGGFHYVECYKETGPNIFEQITMSPAFGTNINCRSWGNSTMFFVGWSSSPYLRFYHLDINTNTLTALANPATMPTTGVTYMASRNGHLVVSSGGDLLYYSYTASSVQFEHIITPNPGTLNDLSWADDNTLLCAPSLSTGELIRYSFSAGVFTQLPSQEPIAQFTSNVARTNLLWDDTGTVLVALDSAAPYLYAFSFNPVSEELSPIIIPSLPGVGSRASITNDHLAVTHSGSKNLSVFSLVAGEFVLLAEPEIALPTSVAVVSWNWPYLAVGYASSSKPVSIYKLVGNSLQLITEELITDYTSLTVIDFYWEDNFLYVLISGADCWACFKLNSVLDTLSQETFFLDSNTSCIRWHPSSEHIFIGSSHTTAPKAFLLAYNNQLDQTGTFIDVGVSSRVQYAEWSGDYLAVIYFTSPYLRLFKLVAGSLVELETPAAIHTTALFMHFQGEELLIGFSTTPTLVYFRLVGDSLVRQTNPAISGQVSFIARYGDYVACCAPATTLTRIYKFQPDNSLISDSTTDWYTRAAWSESGEFLALVTSTMVFFYHFVAGALTFINRLLMPSSAAIRYMIWYNGELLLSTSGGGQKAIFQDDVFRLFSMSSGLPTVAAVNDNLWDYNEFNNRLLVATTNFNVYSAHILGPSSVSNVRTRFSSTTIAAVIGTGYANSFNNLFKFNNSRLNHVGASTFTGPIHGLVDQYIVVKATASTNTLYKIIPNETCTELLLSHGQSSTRLALNPVYNVLMISSTSAPFLSLVNLSLNRPLTNFSRLVVARDIFVTLGNKVVIIDSNYKYVRELELSGDIQAIYVDAAASRNFGFIVVSFISLPYIQVINLAEE